MKLWLIGPVYAQRGLRLLATFAERSCLASQERPAVSSGMGGAAFIGLLGAAACSGRGTGS